MPDVSATVSLTAAEGKPVKLPAGEQVSNAEFLRDGQDLFLMMPDGHAVKIEGYFDHTPDIVTAGGAQLTPQLVQSFLPPSHPNEYAEKGEKTASDAPTPVGKITEVTGEAVVIRGGEKIEAKVGVEIFQGDVIQTAEKGGVNILFVDNTTFAISQNAKLAIDQFVFNAESQEGSSFFSMLQGMFVYTSGLIGKEDPGNVGINTPVGSIGIRGTVVAGNIVPGETSTITVVDGAIVITNAGGTLEMGDSFDTATLTSYEAAPAGSGQMSADSFTSTYNSLAPVAADTFTNVSNGTYQAPGAETTTDNTLQQPAPDSTTDGTTDGTQTAPTETAPQTAPDTSVPDASVPAPDSPVTPPVETAPETQEVAPPAPEGSLLTPETPQPPPSQTQFSDPAQTTSFSDPSAGSFTTAPSGGGSTGGGGGATAASTQTTTPTVNPPTTTTTAPPQSPAINFQFSTQYLSFSGPATPQTADDGINVTWAAGAVIGHISIANFGGLIPTFQINGGPDIMGRTLVPDVPSTPAYDMMLQATPLVPVISLANYNPVTGEADIILNDPLATLPGVNPNFNITITAHDPVAPGTVLAQYNVVFQLNTPSSVGNPEMNLGGAGNDFISASLTPDPVDVMYGGDGNDQLAADPASPNGDTMLGGNGDDIFFLLGPQFHYIDGGNGFDVIDMGSLGAPVTYDFTGNTDVHNIEAVKLLLAGGVGATLTLGLSDVFSMTDGLGGAFSGHDLEVRTDLTGGYDATLNLDLEGWTIDPSSSAGVAPGANLTVNSGSTFTINAAHNGQTVTLVIQPTGGNDVNLNIAN